MQNPLRRRSPLDLSPRREGRRPYILLIAWSLVVLFPIYWLAVTLVEAAGPRSTRARSTSRSSTSSRRSTPGTNILVDLGNDTLRPYMNTVIVGVLERDHRDCVLGGERGLRAGPVHLPAAGRAHRPVDRVLDGRRVRRDPRRRAVAARARLRARRVPHPRPDDRPAVPADARQRRHRVLADLAADPAADRGRRPALRAATSRSACSTRSSRSILTYVATNLPIVVWLMRDYFAVAAARARGGGVGRRRVGLPDRPLDRPADLGAGPRRDVPDRADLLVERVPDRADPHERERPDDAAASSPPRTRRAGRSGGRCRS